MKESATPGRYLRTVPEQRRHKPRGVLSLGLVSPKPPSARLTHVLDNGISPEDLRVLLAWFAAYVDIWQLGLGTAYVETDLPEKLGILNANSVPGLSGRDAAGRGLGAGPGRRLPGLWWRCRTAPGTCR